MNVIASVKGALYERARQFVTRALWVEGTLRGTDQVFRCLFVGNSDTQRYLLARMYEGEPRVLRQRRILIRSLPRIMKGRDIPVDLCIAVLPPRHDRQLAKQCDFRGQENVLQVVDVPSTWDELKTKLHQNAKNAPRLIRKNGLTYRVSKDPEDFRHFYHRMFVPHTRERYGASATIEPFEEMERFFAKGFLLLIEEAGRAIAGSLCLADDRVLTYRRMGVLDADQTHSKKGAQMAVYHFSLELAIERRIPKFDLMKSSAFVNDGVYQHKRKWGATTLPDDEAETWVYYFALGAPDKVASFFRENPVVVHAASGLKVLVGLEKGAELTPAATTDLIDRYRAPGLEGIEVLTSASRKPAAIAFPKA